MGKRSNFERVERDFYPTPESAVLPLWQHLDASEPIIEPCAGDGQRIGILDGAGVAGCVWAGDVEPRQAFIKYCDARAHSFLTSPRTVFITNPPWDRKILHPIIENLSAQAPTWSLFDADWMHTKQSREFMPLGNKGVSGGRIKWLGNKTGKDNGAWYQFCPNFGQTEFIGRT